MRKRAIYDPAKMETQWKKKWAEKGIYETKEGGEKKRLYMLGMFPYPSGAGLHTGHARIYTATDVMARYFRMKGFSVLFPVGWDAFGLPAENAAIKAKQNPMEMVPKNEANFKRQMEMMGLSYDWKRNFSTADPDYYKWTQWLFLKLYSIKNKQGERLVYKKKVGINWCPFCKTGLANEEVLADGTHERCGKGVEQKLMEQWNMRITDYADRLLYDLDEFEWVDEKGKKRKGVDWPRGILEMQKNWIGRKEGVKVRFKIKGEGFEKEEEVFTTRLDTIFGTTFMVIAPEVIRQWLGQGWKASQKVKDYIKESLRKTERQRKKEEKDKTGVKTDLVAVNPISGEELPVFAADYVLAEVGSGVVMGVPAHDERDFEFAKKQGLAVREVVAGSAGKEEEVFAADGKLVNSGEYDGLTSKEARERLLGDLKKKGLAETEVSYHMRDWIFSRQRYWGEPFPLVYCDKCGDENGVVPVAEEDLPVELPVLDSYEPTDTGESPLTRVGEWVETKCPKCGGKARRETDTMPNWAGSCWYFLRFADAGNKEEAWSKEKLERWLPVDWYLGGAEHAVLHLLYARFWVKAFYDLGLLPFEEPFLRLRGVGMVLAEDGKKMSKSLGNVINPDEVVGKFGVDAMRLYEMFMGPWEQSIAWSSRALVGCYRFLERLWRLSEETIENKKTESDPILRQRLNRLVAKVGKDVEKVKFNTSVAGMMELVNAWSKSKQGLSREDLTKLLLMMAPFTPYISEELYQLLRGEGKKGWESIHVKAWPGVEEKLLAEEEVVVVVQVDGKVRASLELGRQEAGDKEVVEKAALEEEKVKKWIEKGKQRAVFVPGRLINFVTG